MPMHALARFSEYPRVFTFFFSLDGRCRRHLFSLSCVGADFVAPSSQRSRRECWGKRSSAFFYNFQSATSSRKFSSVLAARFPGRSMSWESCAVKCDPSAIAIILSRLVDDVLRILFSGCDLSIRHRVFSLETDELNLVK